mmetsp:Transcript_60223/g.136165  ORF Transcript_60223/g.136165 Transcript_60223/m.136165 type:complete len:133 (-) Transcript_60223:394-792(-)
MPSDDETEVYKSSAGTGKLNLKGINFKKKKKKSKKSKKRELGRSIEIAAHERSEASDRRAAESSEEEEHVDPTEFMTEAQKRYHKQMTERASDQARQATSETHRHKVEKFNHLLSTLTEHNDIPRVSAAGNG